MRIARALVAIAASVSSIAAADLTVLSAGAVESAVRTLAKHYEREFGRDVAVAFGTGPELTRRLSNGDRADVLIAPARVMSDAARSRRVLTDTQVEVARVGVGVAVRAGAPTPDVATVDALKQALLRADSVVYNEASTGLYLEELLGRMGILEQLKPRTTRYANAAQVLEHVIRGGGAEIGFAPITEIRGFERKGVTFVAPLPEGVQNYTPYLAAVMTDAGSPDAARDFVRYLTSAAAKRAFASTGVQVSR